MKGTCGLHMTESLSDVVRTDRGSWSRHFEEEIVEVGTKVRLIFKV